MLATLVENILKQNENSMLETFELFTIEGEPLTDISLVNSPATESNWMCFAKQNKEYHFSTDDKHIITGAVMIPDKIIYRCDANGEYNVFFSADTIRKTAENYLKALKNNTFTLEHSDNTNKVSIIESWIKDSDCDKSTALGLNLPNGTWLISAKVNSPELWSEIKNGRFNGFSIAGSFRTATAEEQSLIDEAEEYLNNILK